MVLVDAKYNFIAVDVGAYGKSSDGGIFTHSNLGKAIEQDKLRIPRSVKLPGTSIEVPYVIVGDEAFPLKTYFSSYQVKPIVLCACGAWASTKSDEKRLLLFEWKILRRIYGPKRNEENLYERRTNAELRAMFNEPNIVGILKSRRISWAGHKRPIGRPRQRWTDRVKEDLKLLGIREGEQLAKNRELWRGVVEAAMDLQGPE
ncbi:uncharacterized protein LOC111035356 [Myzus persicae]|uniref:uncharacterized protein LOC111035356 n=1 Tax=Myzus persicae TaxID=13164 RepID=UPI000B936F37|nr:uncharacterized protein LOC111035356 [Myzus persicae]